jgi:hypothetical protein
MINKLRRLYPKHLLFIKRGNRIYDLNNNLIKRSCLPKRKSYIIINENFYEVHNKINMCDSISSHN